MSFISKHVMTLQSQSLCHISFDKGLCNRIVKFLSVLQCTQLPYTFFAVYHSAFAFECMHTL